MMARTLIFVYNARSGLFNALTDVAHKMLSPQTYPCNLCRLTHSNLWMRKEWRQFIESLGLPVQFLHADELPASYAMSNLPLPAVLIKTDERAEVLVSAKLINACRTMDELKATIADRLRGKEGLSGGN